MSGNTNVRLNFSFSSNRVAKAVEEALRPDNIDFPEGLSMKQSVKGNELYIEFYSHGKMETLLNTVDEVLVSISAAVGALGGA
ncbi:MAG: hypothetical protein FJ358_01890 [Thaumarchaeota archaeon]|nr:hypothetical protein [Nitrososphaerota archaeon]